MNRPSSNIKGISISLIFLISIFACNAPQNQSAPTIDIARVVQQTQTSIAVNSLLTPSSDPTEIALEIPAITVTAGELSPIVTSTILPQASATPFPTCIDKAQFKSETIPDNTSFAPSASFTKSWTLTNGGTCTWNTNYSLVWVQGDQLGAPSPYQFSQTVAPGESLVLNLPLIAPASPGEYSSYWKLQNSQNVEFGNLWVKIRVVGAVDQNLGSPTWVESYEDGKSSFGLYSDSNTNFEIKDGNLFLTAYNAAGDLWRVSSKAYPDDFVLEANFTTGKVCNSKDSYGLIVRAPNQANNIIDTGFVFVFSCDGKYRVYRMDKGSFFGIQNWSSASSILAGAEKNNSMRIKAVASKFELFVNGILVFEFLDTAYSVGFFGLVMRSEATPNFQVSISNISYWDLSP